MLPQELSTQLSRDLRKVVSTWQQSENIIYTKLSINPGDMPNSNLKSNPPSVPIPTNNVGSRNVPTGSNAGGLNGVLNSGLNSGLNGKQTGSLAGSDQAGSLAGPNSNQNSKLNSVLRTDAAAASNLVNDENELNPSVGKLDKRQQAFLDELNHQPDALSNHEYQMHDLDAHHLNHPDLTNHDVDQHAIEVDQHFNVESTHLESTADHQTDHQTDAISSIHLTNSNQNKVSAFNRSLFPAGKVQQRPASGRLDSNKFLDGRLNERVNERGNERVDERLNERVGEKLIGKQTEHKPVNRPPKGKQSNDKPNRSDGRSMSGNSLGNKLSSAKLSSQNFKSSSNNSRSNRLSSGKQSKGSSRSFGSRTPNKTNFNTNYDSPSRSPSNQLPTKHASSFRQSTNQTNSLNRNQTNFAQSNVIKLAKQPESNLKQSNLNQRNGNHINGNHPNGQPHINYEVFQNDAQPTTNKPTSKPSETANTFPDSDTFPDNDYLGDTADQYDRLSETVIYAGPVNRFVSDNLNSLNSPNTAAEHAGQPSDGQTAAHGEQPPSMMWTRLRLTRPSTENLMTIRPAEIPLFSSPIAIGHSLQNVLPSICDHVEIHNPSLILSLLDTDRHQAASFISQTAFIPMLSFSGEYQISPTSTHVSVRYTMCVPHSFLSL